MSNRFTHKIADGEQSLRDYMLSCAGGMGAYLTEFMESSSSFRPSPIPEFDSTNWDAIIDRKRGEVDAVLEMTVDELEERQNELINRRFIESAEIHNDSVARIARYRSRYEELYSLDLPEELENLKNAMLEEMDKSWEHDCDKGVERPAPVREEPLDVESFRSTLLRDANGSLSSAVRGLERDRANHNERKAFSDLVFANLPKRNVPKIRVIEDDCADGWKLEF